jgi:predicted TIM-barrel fold metal-dependent hydrolase
MGAHSGIDCHNHIIDPARFPFSPQGGYRPRPDENGTKEDFAAVLDTYGMSYALLVQPSCYGTDNRAILDAVAWQPTRFKAIGVLDPTTSDHELEHLRARGMVGVRFNLPFDPEALIRPAVDPFLARLKVQGWFVQVHGRDADWADAAPILKRSGVRLIVDHMGLETAEDGLHQRGFKSVLALGRETDAVVKLSAFYRMSQRAPAFEDLDPFIAAVIQNFGITRCIWGSDWPFLDASLRPAYDEVLAPLLHWLPNEDDRRAVFWDNPCRLFCFEKGAPP